MALHCAAFLKRLKTDTGMHKMKKQNKYRYLTILQGNYGYGWDDLMQWDKNKDDLIFISSLEFLCWYRQNEKQALHRIIKRRELNK